MRWFQSVRTSSIKLYVVGSRALGSGGLGVEGPSDWREHYLFIFSPVSLKFLFYCRKFLVCHQGYFVDLLCELLFTVVRELGYLFDLEGQFVCRHLQTRRFWAYDRDAFLASVDAKEHRLNLTRVPPKVSQTKHHTTSRGRWAQPAFSCCSWYQSQGQVIRFACVQFRYRLITDP